MKTTVYGWPVLGGVLVGILMSVTTTDGVDTKVANTSNGTSVSSSKTITVCFTPNKVCEQNIVAKIRTAKHRIRVQAYSFTDADLGNALVDMKKTGVDVMVILDKSNKTSPSGKMSQMVAAGIPTRIDSPTGIAHSKIILIDDDLVITGSYNFSKNAYSANAENSLMITSAELMKEYLSNFLYRWSLSVDAK